ncbi:helicase-related protein [Shewanella psychrotolerans]|uniref:helicase-related protein n=1 Tax=Shewanella psychrotolerans TaxID=2864206 RepID=UPI001C654EBC|nr:helicase-related protein [Shewanella psychrotolerans]QYK01422.1 DEAD/DEAH box helicase [Shewanella psychrotolerans]
MPNSSVTATLPIDKLYNEFKLVIKNHHLVVESDTGSGKSTRLPLWCAEANDKGKTQRVLVIEPRRVACLALADFVAKQTQLQVGYAIRFDSTVNEQTDIAFVTPGIGLRWLSANAHDAGDNEVGNKAELACFDTIIIDEFHERRWDTDLLLALLKTTGKHRLVITSATIDGERLANYLTDNNGNKAARLQAEGRRFHVELRYQSTESHHLPDVRDIDKKVKQAVESLLVETAGDILVFLPGKKEIQTCLQACQGLLATNDGLELLGLHGGIDAKQQQAILSETEYQRVIFATNVAETSLTIPGVTAVVDSGLERRTHQRNGRTVLSLARISKASSEQRLGRAGRVQAGICIRLWGKGAPLEAITPPEMQREELVESLLAAACSGYQLSTLPFVDKLPEKSLTKATEQLLSMTAIDSAGLITDHGRKLFPLPIDTQFAHLISAMPDDVCKGLMVDLAAALTVPGQIYTLPVDEFGLQQLGLWEPFGCDAYLIIKLLRANVPDWLTMSDANQSLLKEARFLASQIRAALNLPVGKEDDLANAELRLRWCLAAIKALPALAFIRREKRQQALGNGYSEVQIARDSRFDIVIDKQALPIAAVVFDQFALAGRGAKQTLNLATCMAPISVETLLNAELGEERLASNKELADDAVLIERVYAAGRIINTYRKQVWGEQAIEAIVRSICEGRHFKGLGQKLSKDIAAWNIWLALGNMDDQMAGVKPDFDQPLELACYLNDRLIELGVESFADLELIEASDLFFEGVPDWQRQEFDQLYPLELVLADLKLAVSYLPKRKLVLLEYLNGQRKTGPKRWELPRWLGWKIQYKKASRVVDIK